jgi:transcriptional regulator with XRE-family HTH domain
VKDDVTPVDVAANIRAELGRRRVTYRELAKRLADRSDLNEVTLSRRLNGQIEFRHTELIAVAEALDVPVSVLLGEEARAS